MYIIVIKSSSSSSSSSTSSTSTSSLSSSTNSKHLWVLISMLFPETDLFDPVMGKKHQKKDQNTFQLLLFIWQKKISSPRALLSSYSYQQTKPNNAHRTDPCMVYLGKRPLWYVPFLVKYRCYITTNSIVFSVSQVSNLVSPDMKRIQRGKFKAMKKPRKNVTKASNSVLNFRQSPWIVITCIDIWWIMVVGN